jgi:uncharacterized membrane protein YebE (DUF533 family)
MLLRLATLGALGYAAYNYYTKNREQVDGALRRLTQGGSSGTPSPNTATDNSGGDQGVDLAGGPLSGSAQLVHAGEGPVA